MVDAPATQPASERSVGQAASGNQLRSPFGREMPMQWSAPRRVMVSGDVSIADGQPDATASSRSYWSRARSHAFNQRTPPGRPEPAS